MAQEEQQQQQHTSAQRQSSNSPPAELVPIASGDGAREEQEKEEHVEGNNTNGEEQKEEGEEEEMECGFCLFMKGGGCKDPFIAWEKCVEDAEKNKEDIVEKCFEVTRLLKECMDAHADYYQPLLKAEEAMKEEAARELNEKANSDVTTTEATSENSDKKVPSDAPAA